MATRWTADPTRNAGARTTHDPTAAPTGGGGGVSGSLAETQDPQTLAVIGVTGFDLHAILSLSAEATTAGVGTDELVSVSGASEWFFTQQAAGAIETVAGARRVYPVGEATDPVTFTYVNPQTNNGVAVQFGLGGLVIPAGGWDVITQLADSPFLFAHRGHGGWWPEETVYAYRQAAFNDKALDIDVVRSSDGVYVCHHDLSTLRMTGSNLDIPSTPWATLSALNNNPVGCVDGTQPVRPMARLEEVLDEFIDSHVLSIELKGSSTGMTDLLTLIGSYPNAQDHVIGQQFAGGQTQLTAWKNAGYTTWANAFDAEIDTSSLFGSNVDLIGLNWDATVAQWTTAIGYGKPVIGHIISTKTQADQALTRGASGLTVSRW